MRLTLVMLACAAVLAAPLAAQGTRIVLLGTGTPNPDPGRSGPALAILVNGSAYLVDAGPGVVRRAEAARRRGHEELAEPNLKIVFLTHLHSDHTLGLADLIFTPWVLERSAPLTVYGPAGTRAMMAHLGAAFREDVRIRLDGWQPQNTTGYRVDAHEIQAGVIYRDSNVRVTAFEVPHGTVPDAFGYKFETADRTIVISGDTGPSDAVIKACDPCDVLVHEVYSDRSFATRPPEWRRYHAFFHTSATELAAIATRAKPRLLLLTHLLLWGTTPEELLGEVRRLYGGRVLVGTDLEVY